MMERRTKKLSPQHVAGLVLIASLPIISGTCPVSSSAITSSGQRAAVQPGGVGRSSSRNTFIAAARSPSSPPQYTSAQTPAAS